VRLLGVRVAGLDEQQPADPSPTPTDQLTLTM
jgi:hypothetical protein